MAKVGLKRGSKCVRNKRAKGGVMRCAKFRR